MDQEPAALLKGYRILVTGGTTGIGRATALELASRGANVLIGGANPQHMRDALESSKLTRGQINGVVADMATKKGVLEMFAAVDAQLGGMDIAILNAGLGGSGSLMEMDHDRCRNIVDINLKGYLSCALESMKRMSGRGGQIILIGSMSAEVCEKYSAAYVASKAGIRGLAKSLRKEANPHGVRVSLIEPGKTDTDMQDAPPTERQQQIEQLEMLTAQDVARCVSFVLSQPDRCDIVLLQVRPRLQEI
jgi:NAD(P)-dependent dehydrogenase (short-subunit alcohol dehydrogenase family)